MEDKTTVDAIARLMVELAETRGKMKTIKDDLKDIAEQNDEYRALQEELKEMSEKRATAKKLLAAATLGPSAALLLAACGLLNFAGFVDVAAGPEAAVGVAGFGLEGAKFVELGEREYGVGKGVAVADEGGVYECAVG